MIAASAWPEACSYKAWSAVKWLFHFQGAQRSKCMLQDTPFGAFRLIQTPRWSSLKGNKHFFENPPWFCIRRKARDYKQLIKVPYRLRRYIPQTTLMPHAYREPPCNTGFNALPLPIYPAQRQSPVLGDIAMVANLRRNYRLGCLYGTPIPTIYPLPPSYWTRCWPAGFAVSTMTNPAIN